MRISRWFDFLPSRAGVLGINARNLHYIYTHNDRRFFPNVDDKLRCKRLLIENGIPTPVVYFVVDGPDALRGMDAALADKKNFVLKPNRGFGGNGIMFIWREEDRFHSSDGPLTRGDIVFHVLQLCAGTFSMDNSADIAVFEETIVNVPEMNPFTDTPEGHGAADIRIIFQHDTPVMAMLRLPTSESQGKANLHQGGIGVGIDIDTGKTLHGCHRNKIVLTHPDTGVALAGMQLPFFNEMLAIGARICEIVGLGYVGVDYVCDKKNGPMILEVNARPGLNIQLANQLGLRKKLK